MLRLKTIDRNYQSYPRLNADEERLIVKFQNPDVDDLEGWMNRCITDLFGVIKSDLNITSQDRIGINFANPDNEKINFVFSFRRFDQYNPEMILSGLENVIQSNSKLFLENNLSVNVDHVKIPLGFGRRCYIGKSNDEYFKIHKS